MQNQHFPIAGLVFPPDPDGDLKFMALIPVFIRQPQNTITESSFLGIRRWTFSLPLWKSYTTERIERCIFNLSLILVGYNFLYYDYLKLIASDPYVTVPNFDSGTWLSTVPALNQEFLFLFLLIFPLILIPDLGECYFEISMCIRFVIFFLQSIIWRCTDAVNFHCVGKLGFWDWL